MDRIVEVLRLLQWPFLLNKLRPFGLAVIPFYTENSFRLGVVAYVGTSRWRLL